MVVPKDKKMFIDLEKFQCSENCGIGTQTRRIFCSAGPQEELYCDKNTKPENTRNCSNSEQCGGRWFSSPWSQVSPLSCLKKQPTLQKY